MRKTWGESASGAAASHPALDDSMGLYGSPMRSGGTHSPLQPLEQHTYEEWKDTQKNWEVQRYEEVSNVLHQIGISPARARTKRKSKKRRSKSSNEARRPPWLGADQNSYEIPDEVERVQSIHNEQYLGTFEKEMHARRKADEVKTQAPQMALQPKMVAV